MVQLIKQWIEILNNLLSNSSAMSDKSWYMKIRERSPVIIMGEHTDAWHVRNYLLPTLIEYNLYISMGAQRKSHISIYVTKRAQYISVTPYE